MPELPEVETVVRQLDELLPGERFLDFHLLRKLVMPDHTTGELTRSLGGKRIDGVCRRGKFILIAVEEGHPLCIHLGMTGRLLWEDGRSTVADHLRWRAGFQSGHGLLLDDIRCFSRVFLAPGEGCGPLEQLGPEPLGNGISPDYLSGRLGSSGRRIKDLLLDQRMISGLGNIYANEALFIAKVNPMRRGRCIGCGEFVAINDAIRDTLANAIQRCGTSISDFCDVFGQPGMNQDHLLVYGREGEPCPRCGATIIRIREGGRSSFFCPECQPAP